MPQDPMVPDELLQQILRQGMVPQGNALPPQPTLGQGNAPTGPALAHGDEMRMLLDTMEKAKRNPQDYDPADLGQMAKTPTWDPTMARGPRTPLGSPWKLPMSGPGGPGPKMSKAERRADFEARFGPQDWGSKPPAPEVPMEDLGPLPMSGSQMTMLDQRPNGIHPDFESPMRQGAQDVPQEARDAAWKPSFVQEMSGTRGYTRTMPARPVRPLVRR